MAVALKERFVVDDTGNRVAVLLDIDEYQRVLEALEELETITAYDEAKGWNDGLTRQYVKSKAADELRELGVPSRRRREAGDVELHREICNTLHFLP
jgi:hypothetical protein